MKALTSISLSVFAAVSIFGMSAMASSVGEIACNHGYGASPSVSCGGGSYQAEPAPEFPEYYPQPEQLQQSPVRRYRRPVRVYRPVTKSHAVRHQR